MTDQQTGSSNAREVQYWNSAHTRAWADEHETIDRLFAGLTQIALDYAAPKPGERVIDIGCGSGTTVLEVAGRVGPTGYVLGADVSKPSVEKARERIATAGVHQAEIMLCDVSTHTFPANSFDLVFSRFGVMFFADPVATFAKIRKAMKSDGRLALAVFRTPQENKWATAALAAVRHLLPPITPLGPEEPGQFSWADPARVHRILEGAGFKEVSLTPHEPAMPLAGPGGAAEAASFMFRVGPVLRATKDASEEQRQAVRSALETFFRSQDGPHGIVLQGAIWIVRAQA
ncbi:MAG TPA: class I SAM-dependent methyltransferase [Pseudolabrys sp.]|jgi:ubiquinone/menaquinone biosynthesis C-methylase UbiE|nr:class I SAM-dependent methyltransferase [Pseudolabrys sp.]